MSISMAVNTVNAMEEMPSQTMYWHDESLAYNSKALSDILDASGYNVDERTFKTITMDIIDTIKDMGMLYSYGFAPFCYVSMGSSAEATFITETSDIDDLSYFPVVEAKDESIEARDIVLGNRQYHYLGMPYLRMVKDANTRPGYTKLQPMLNTGELNNDALLKLVFFDSSRFVRDNDDRLCLSNTWGINSLIKTSRITRHGPAETRTLIHDSDCVIGYACNHIPSEIQPWFLRNKPYGWPSSSTCALFLQLGCFVVPKGHPDSPSTAYEWRLSPSLQERYLMLHLNQVQYHCYILLKMIKTYLLKPHVGDAISSYHCKTALFYTIENTSQTIWIAENLVRCLLKCIRQLYEWVDTEHCPNYFMPDENMFDGRLNIENKLVLKIILKKMLDSNGLFLGKIKIPELKENISNLIEFKDICDLSRVMIWKYKYAISGGIIDFKFGLSKTIMKIGMLYRTKEKNADTIIEELKDILKTIEIIKTMIKSKYNLFLPFFGRSAYLLFLQITNQQYISFANQMIRMEHEENKQKIKRHLIGLTLFKPYLQSKVASLLLAKSVADKQERTWLEGYLYSHFGQAADNLSNQIKLGSSCFAHSHHLMCHELLLNVLAKYKPKTTIVCCVCSSPDRRSYELTQADVIDDLMLQLNFQNETMNDQETSITHLIRYHLPMVHSCVVFDEMELNLVSLPLFYETYRSFGKYQCKEIRLDNLWFESVAIDPFVCLYFVLYQNSCILNDRCDACRILFELENTILNDRILPKLLNGYSGAGIVNGHLDTALNILEHVYLTKGWKRLAVECFRMSLQIRPEEVNAVKWHVMFSICSASDSIV